MVSNGDYSVVEIKRRDGVGSHEILMRDCGDYVEATSRQPLINKDALVAASGDELKPGVPSVSFSVPAFIHKFPKRQFDIDDAESERVMVDANKEALQKYKSFVTEAYKKARNKYMKEHNISVDQLSASTSSTKQEIKEDQLQLQLQPSNGSTKQEIKENQLQAPTSNMKREIKEK